MATITRTLGFLFLTALVVFNTIPYIWLTIGSFLPNSDTDRGILVPSLQSVSVDNYAKEADYQEVMKHLWNTIRVSLFSSLIVAATSALAGYGLTRFAKRLLPFSKAVVMGGYLLSPVTLVIPYAVLLNDMRLSGSIYGLVLANTAFCFPFGFFLMQTYMEGVSLKFDQTAAADGAGWWQTFLHIMVPRTWPGLAAVAMFSFILSWNDVALATVLASTENKTLVIWLKELLEKELTQYGTFAAASIWIAFMAMLVFGLVETWIDNTIRKERGGRG
jgi:ABC-type glycerol-3-phosphate transport system permease component